MIIHKETVLDKVGDVKLIGHELVEVSFRTWLLHKIKYALRRYINGK